MVIVACHIFILECNSEDEDNQFDEIPVQQQEDTSEDGKSFQDHRQYFKQIKKLILPLALKMNGLLFII